MVRHPMHLPKGIEHLPGYRCYDVPQCSSRDYLLSILLDTLHGCFERLAEVQNSFKRDLSQ